MLNFQRWNHLIIRFRIILGINFYHLTLFNRGIQKLIARIWNLGIEFRNFLNIQVLRAVTKPCPMNSGHPFSRKFTLTSAVSFIFALKIRKMANSRKTFSGLRSLQRRHQLMKHQWGDRISRIQEGRCAINSNFYALQALKTNSHRTSKKKVSYWKKTWLLIHFGPSKTTILNFHATMFPPSTNRCNTIT